MHMPAKTSSVCGFGLSHDCTAQLTDDREKSSIHRTFGPCWSPNLLLRGVSSGISSSGIGPTNAPDVTSSKVFVQTCYVRSLSQQPLNCSWMAPRSMVAMLQSSSTPMTAGWNFAGQIPVFSTAPTSSVPFLNSSTTPRSS